MLSMRHEGDAFYRSWSLKLCELKITSIRLLFYHLRLYQYFIKTSAYYYGFNLRHKAYTSLCVWRTGANSIGVGRYIGGARG